MYRSILVSMPYTRKPRKTVRRKRYPSRKSTLATQVKAIVNRQAEKKVKYVTWDEAIISTLSQGAFYDPMEISQGDTATQRSGVQIRLQGIHLRGVLHNNGSNPNYVRMVVFYAKERADMTSASDIFESNTQDAAGFSTYSGLNCIYQPFNKALMNVLYTRTFKLAGNDAIDGSQTMMFNKFIKLKNRLVRFQGNTTGSDDVAPRLHVGWWAAEAPDDTTSGQTIELSGFSKLFFTDM